MDADMIEHKILKYVKKYHKDPKCENAKIYKKKIIYYHQKIQNAGGNIGSSNIPFDPSLFGKIDYTDTIAQSISD